MHTESAFRRLLFVAPCLILGASSLPAASLTWNNGQSNLVWDTTSTNWGGSTLWNNATPDSAFFGATGAGMITLGTAITADAVTFNTSGYVLNGGANNLTASTLDGAGDFTKIGTNTIALSGVSSYSGILTVGNGFLQLSSGASLLSGGGLILQGGAGALGGSGYPFLGVTRGGTLYLRDNTAGNVVGSQTVALNNGSLLWYPNSSGAYSETIPNLSLAGGFNTLAVAPNSGSATLQIGDLARASGATVEFRAANNILGADAQFRITNLNASAIANVNGILGGWAFAASASSAANYSNPARSFATWNGSTVTNALPDKANGSSGGAVNSQNISAGISTENWLANSTSGNRTLTADTVINSLIEERDLFVNSGATLTLNSGGLILRNNSFWMQTSGTGFLTSGTNDLYLQADGGGGDQAIKVIIKDGPAGAVTLRKSGSGLVKLEQNHTYTGGTIVNQGTLRLDTGGGTGCLRGSVTVNPGGTLGLNATDALGYTSTSTTVTNVNIIGGTVDNLAAGNNGYYTTFNLTGGTLSSSGGGSFNFESNSAINSQSSPVVSTISGPISLRVDGVPICTAQGAVANGVDLLISGVIGQNAVVAGTPCGIVKSQAGTLQLSAANTYGGPTTVNGGMLYVTGTLRGSTNFLVRSNSTFKLDASNIFTTGHNVAMTATRVITVDNAALLMGTNFSSRVGNITLRNGATWTCDRPVTGGGSSGYDALLANTSTGAATVLVTNTSGASAATMNGYGGVRLENVQQFDIADVTGSSASDLNVSLVLADKSIESGSTNGGINKLGNGTMTLSAANTYSNVTVINAGTLALTGSGSINNSRSITLNSSGATFDVSGATFTLGANQPLIGLGSVVGTLSVASGGNITATNSGGNLSFGGLAFNGIATNNVRPGVAYLIVTSANGLTASGAANSVKINLGTGVLTAGTYTLIDYDGTIQGTGFSAFQLGTTPGGLFTYTLVDNVANSSVDLLVTAMADTWTGTQSSEWSTNTISGSKNWKQSGSPKDFVNGDDVIFDDTATGTTTVDLSVADVTPASLLFNNVNSNYTLQGTAAIAGSIGLTKTGAGTVTINNTNKFVGAVSISAGTVAVGNIANKGVNSALGAGTNISLGGATLSYTGGSASSDRPIAMTAGSTLNVPSGATSLILTGAVSGAFTLTKTGAGTLVLQNPANSYGATTMNEGTVSVADNLALGSSGPLNFGGGTLALTGSSAISSFKSVVLNSGGGTIQVDNTAGVTLNSGISGSGGLTKTGTGTLTLNATETYTGGTVVNNGTLTLPTGGAAGNIRGSLTVNSGATCTLSGVNAFGYNSTSDTLTNCSIAGGTLNNTSGGDEGYFTTFNLNGGTMSGGGFWIFGSSANSAINSFSNASASTISGNMYLKGDVTDLPITTALGTAPSGVDLTISAVISGDSGKGIVKSGLGTLRLSNGNTYSGATTVNGGILDVTGYNGLLNSSSFTVVSNSTFRLNAANVFTANHATLMQNARMIAVENSTLLMETNFEARFANVTLKNGSTWTCNRGLTSYDALMANTGLGAATVLVTNTSGTAAATMNGTGGIHLQGVQNFDVADVTGGSAPDLVVSMILSGPGTQGGAAGGINKKGNGTMTLSAVNTYNGDTTISAGTLALSGSGSITSTPSITLNSSTAVFDVSATNFTLGANQTLAGNGTVIGPVNVASGGVVTAGTNNIGSLTLAGLTFNGAATVNIRPGTASLIVTDANGLAASGGANSVTLNLGTNALATGSYTLIDYTGGIQGAGFSAFQLGSAPVGLGCLLVDNATNGSVDVLVFTNTPPAISVGPSPADGAIGVTNYPVLNVTVTDPNPGNLTVTFYGRVAPPASAVDFTLVALPDTQYYVSSLYGGSPDIFTNQTQWIVNNRTNRNIAYVTQLGDCVEHGDNGGNDVEWRNATNALYRLEDPVSTQYPPFGIPYGVAVGNHDNSTDSSGVGTTTFYNQYFGEAHFSPYNYYGGHYSTNNDNHFDLFSAGGMDFVILYFEYDETATSTNAAVYAWANSVLATNANRRAIVVSHWILNDGGSFGPQGQTIYNALKGNTNLFLMLCGHINTGTGEALRSDTFNNRTVWSVLSDYQQRSPNGGNGLLRLYEFSPADNVIHVKTYSPWLSQFETDANSQFDIPYAMTPTEPFAVLGTATGIPPGTNASVTWPGLVTNTTYEWYVTVSDGQATTTGPRWRFTTDSIGGPIRPNVSLTAPADNAAFTNPPAINLAATAADPDGTVTNVAFYQGTTKLADDASAPFNFWWTGVAAGSYALRAVATDSSGLSTTSSVVNITVVAPTTVTRTPYLQNGSHTAVTVRWRTAAATDSSVRYGTNSANLNLSATDAVSTNEHEVRLTGLAPDTHYFYSVGTVNMPLAGGDTNFYVLTAPLPGTHKPTRIWVLGDAGTKDASQIAVRDAYYNFAGARHTDLWLMLGDNAYDTGTDSDFQAAVFDMYPTVLRNSVLWPTLGNHETGQSTDFNANWPYFDMFTLPKNGEAGGIASGTEHYYSFDYANIHFICLDSMTASRSSSGAMATWLTNDLSNATAEWIIAFWHHPPYTKGSHDSDAETELIEMRQNILPLLETCGVDLVMSGHSHAYERSYLLDGHYGLSGTLTSGMKLDGGNGQTNGTGAYVKLAGGNKIAHKGAVYVVAGSSGQVSGGSLNHPAMYLSLNNLGSFVLDVASNRLDAKFVRETGAVDDFFTIIKSNAPPVTTNLTFTLNADSATNLTLTASDPNGDALTFATNSSPTRGLISNFNPTSGGFTYTPAHGFSGADSFTFTASDSQANSAATAGLNVVALADANTNGIPDSWESAFGILDANADDDADGASNLYEYLANTNPTNNTSKLKLISVTATNGHATIAWSAIGGTRYRVTYTDSLTAPFTDIVRPVAQEMNASPLGSPSVQTCTDNLAAPPDGTRFFRIKVVQ